MFMLMLHKKIMGIWKCLCYCYIWEDDGNEEMFMLLLHMRRWDGNEEMFMLMIHKKMMAVVKKCLC